jgi:hypothetical protein
MKRAPPPIFTEGSTGPLTAAGVSKAAPMLFARPHSPEQLLAALAWARHPATVKRHLPLRAKATPAVTRVSPGGGWAGSAPGKSRADRRVSLAAGRDGLYFARYNGAEGRYFASWATVEAGRWTVVKEAEFAP